MNSYSIGVIAFNEGANIARLLRNIANQKLTSGVANEVIVVSSGSSDRTNEIIAEFSKHSNKIKLLTQARRLGKSSAINLFLQNAKNEICILINGDAYPGKDALQKLIVPLENPLIGMVGAQPIPLNNSGTFIDFVIHFLWRLHHRISLKSPKMSELIVIRKSVINHISEYTVADEVYMESVVKKSSCKMAYIPDATVYIKTPANIKDFILQRRRITVGHIWSKINLKYTPSTCNKGLIIEAYFKELKSNPQCIFFALGAISLEFISRMLGIYDYYILKKNPYIWKVVRPVHKDL